MEQTPEVRIATPGSSGRLDTLLRWLVVLGVAVVLGLGGLLGYSVWQARNAEDLSTPAGRAIADLKDRVKATPNDAELRVRLGEALATAGLIDEAIEQFRTAVKLEPEAHRGLPRPRHHRDAEEAAQDRRGLLQQGRRAHDEQRDARTSTSGRETAFFYLGEIALDAKRYEDAVANFKASLRIRRDASDTYYLLAQALKGMDRNDAALKQLDAALAFDPNYAEAHYLMGEIYLDRRRQDQRGGAFPPSRRRRRRTRIFRRRRSRLSARPTRLSRAGRSTS